MVEKRLTLKEFLDLPRAEQNVRYRELSDHDKFGARQADISLKIEFVACNECANRFGNGSCKAFSDSLIPGVVVAAATKDTNYQCSKEYKYTPKEK